MQQGLKAFFVSVKTKGGAIQTLYRERKAQGLHSGKLISTVISS